MVPDRPDKICSHTTRIITAIYFNLLFYLTVLTNVTLASSNSSLPDDGDYTETCWSYFNVNFNTPFKKHVHQLV
jgi:hypothetical protein